MPNDDARLAAIFAAEEAEQYAPEEAGEEAWWSMLKAAWLVWHARNLAGYRQRVHCSCGMEWIVAEGCPFDGRTSDGTPADRVKALHRHDTTARPQYKTETVQIGALVDNELRTVPVES